MMHFLEWLEWEYLSDRIDQEEFEARLDNAVRLEGESLFELPVKVRPEKLAKRPLPIASAIVYAFAAVPLISISIVVIACAGVPFFLLLVLWSLGKH